MSATTIDTVPVSAPPRPRRRSGRMRLYLRRFLRNKTAVVGLVVFVLLVLLAIFGKLLTPWTYYSLDFDNFSEPPSALHWFGTTGNGGDMFAQVVHGLGRSLVIGLTVSAGTLLIGAFLGALAAYLGGKPEKVILGFINFLLACPSFLLMAIIALKSGGNWIWLIFVLTLFNWMIMGRVIWQLSTSIREREFVAAARYMGVPGPVVVFRHIVPNIGSLLVVEFVVGVVNAVMSETALSYLGFGILIPDVSLGSLLTSGQSLLYTTPWAFWFPAGALTLLTVSIAFMADGLRDALDPTSAAGGKA